MKMERMEQDRSAGRRWGSWGLTGCMLIVSALGGLGGRTACGEDKAAGSVPLQEYDFPMSDGLYATVVSRKELPRFVLSNERKIKLRKQDTGFQEDLECRAYWLAGRNPLAVVLVGLNARANSELSRVWQQYLLDAGCSVMVFDSVFYKDFQKCTLHGVAGNVEAEARIAAKVIQEFLKQPEPQGRVSSVRLLGASYGASIALALNNLAKSGKAEVAVERVLALSPPLSLKQTAEFLDRWYTEDLKPRELGDLMPLLDAKPLARGEQVLIAAPVMRAGIAYVFREDLKEIVKQTDKLYQLNLLNRFEGDANPELRDKGKWSFTQYLSLMAVPYWKEHGGPSDLEGLLALGGLRSLLAPKPDNARVILAADDPLNAPADLDEVQRSYSAPLLTVLPNGGHLGYARTDWIEKYIAAFMAP